MTTISKLFEFSASHQLVGLPGEHPCSRLHGHNYTVKLTLEGDLNEVGFVMDYRELEPFKRRLDAQFDHQHLNDVVDYNPTAELLAAGLTALAQEALSFTPNVRSIQVAVSETGKTWAEASAQSVNPGVAPHLLDAERYRWNDDAWGRAHPEHHVGGLKLKGEGA